jgi:hypothetical protein
MNNNPNGNRRTDVDAAKRAASGRQKTGQVGPTDHLESQKERSVAQPAANTSSETLMDVDTLEEGQFIGANAVDADEGFRPVGRRNTHISQTTLGSALPQILLPTSIELDDGKKKGITDLEATTWLIKHRIVSAHALFKRQYEGHLYWGCRVTRELYDQLKEKDWSSTSTGLTPIFVNPSEPDPEVYEQYFAIGLLPGNDTVSNEVLTMHIQGILELYEIRYTSTIRIAWNKQRTERMAAIFLRKGDKCNIERINKGMVFMLGHQLLLECNTEHYSERLKEERLRTLSIFGLPFKVQGKQLEILANDLGAMRVRMEGFRLPSTGKLVPGTTARFIFSSREEAQKVADQAVKVQNRLFYLRWATTTNGTNNKYCYTCGKPDHFSKECRDRKFTESHKQQRIEAFLSGKLNKGQSKQMAASVTQAEAVGKSVLPPTYAAYAMAAKKGAMVDPAIGKKREQLYYEEKLVATGSTKTTQRGATNPSTNIETNTKQSSQVANLEERFNEKFAQLRREFDTFRAEQQQQMTKSMTEMAAIISEAVNKNINEKFDRINETQQKSEKRFAEAQRKTEQINAETRGSLKNLSVTVNEIISKLQELEEENAEDSTDIGTSSQSEMAVDEQQGTSHPHNAKRPRQISPQGPKGGARGGKQ